MCVGGGGDQTVKSSHLAMWKLMSIEISQSWGFAKARNCSGRGGGQEAYWIFRTLFAYITLLKIEVEFTKEKVSTKMTGCSK